MSLSRWKIMAGMFGLSLAGIYAVAGPGTKAKTDVKGEPVNAGALVFSEPPLMVPLTPVIQVSGVLPVAPPAELVVPAAPVFESLPHLIPAPLPQAMTVPIPSVEYPYPKQYVEMRESVSAPTPAPLMTLEKPVLWTTPPVIVLQTPNLVPTVREPEPLGLNMPSSITLPRTMPEPPVCTAVPVEFKLPPILTFVTSLPTAPAPTLLPAADPLGTEGVRSPGAMAASRFRIVLRVGEGEPVFEVRSGDNLVMKVISEKVEVKSPLEKGQSLSSVKAMGKVRFIGFGAEGFCEELSFLAGTGEVCLAGGVRVQVKDKLGRVESELTGEKMNYRLDAANSSLAGGLEP